MTDPVVIIGAGPAGCAAAITLARAGWRTVVIESKPFPRAKVCGEFVSPAASGVLEGLLPAAELVRAGARRCSTLELRVGERRVRWAMPSAAWVLSRRALDEALRDEAVRAGVDVRQPARATGVAYGDESCAVTLAGGEVVRASLVLHADGRGRLDVGTGAGVTPPRNGVVGLKCHLRGTADAPGGTLVMRSARGAYFGVIGVESGEATLAMVARDGLVRAHAAKDGGRDAAIDRLLREVAPETAGYERLGPWLACPVGGSRFRAGGHPRSIRLGNAAAAVEPVGGEGIGLALWSGVTIGRLLAGACVESVQAGSAQAGAVHVEAAQLAGVRREFGGRYRERLRWRLPACRMAAAVLERPWVAGMMMPVMGAAGGRPLEVWYRLTGKPAGAGA